jgi:methionine-rich copper-binding protein CopC
MKKLLLMFLSIALFAGSSAFAGPTKLVKSTPEEGSVSDSPPAVFVLEFTDAVLLHAVYLKKDNDKEKSLHFETHSETRIITIPAPPLPAGHYSLEWQVFASNSSVLRGRVRFTVSGATVTAPPSTP